MSEEANEVTSLKQATKQEKEDEKIPIIKTEQNIKDEYFKALQIWETKATLQAKAMAYFPYYLMSTYPQLFQTPTQPTTPVPTVNRPTVPPRRTDLILDPARHEEIINQNGGYEYEII